MGLRLVETKEQRKSLSCGNQEDASTDYHHDRLLDILLLIVHFDVMAISWLCYVNIRHKSLIINTPLFWEQMWCSQIVPTAFTGKSSVKVVSTKVPNFVQIQCFWRFYPKGLLTRVLDLLTWFFMQIRWEIHVGNMKRMGRNLRWKTWLSFQVS